MKLKERLSAIKEKLNFLIENGEMDLQNEFKAMCSHEHESELCDSDKEAMKDFLEEISLFQEKVVNKIPGVKSKALVHFMSSIGCRMTGIQFEALLNHAEKIKNVFKFMVFLTSDDDFKDRVGKPLDSLISLNSGNLWETIKENSSIEAFEDLEKRVEIGYRKRKENSSGGFAEFMKKMIENMGNHSHDVKDGKLTENEFKNPDEYIKKKLEEDGISIEEFEMAKMEIKRVE